MLAAVAWFVLFFPEEIINARHFHLSAKDRLDAESSMRSSLLQVAGGIAALAGLYYTARSFRITREGHITDRYTNSVGQLGGDKVEVRIGAVFALERLAKDSSIDKATVVELLTAFVREQTKSGPQSPRDEVIGADVQAAVTVLGRHGIADGYSQRLDFYHCGLRGASFSGGNFGSSMFYYSNLKNATFSGANLDGAGLSFCQAEGMAFTKCSARHASFVNAKYVKGWFLAADLTGADFYGCDLRGSDFGRRYPEEGVPRMPPAVLTGARLARAKLAGTNLRGVDLSTVRGLQREQLAEAITDDNTIPPIVWGGGEDEY